MKKDHTQIKTYEDACKALNLEPVGILPTVSSFPEKHRKALMANAKLIIIAEALNDGWQPDWNNSSEYKYYPWFYCRKDDENPSGFAFSNTHYDWTLTLTNVSSRLCFKEDEIAEYAAKQFEELYRDLLMFT